MHAAFLKCNTRPKVKQNTVFLVFTSSFSIFYSPFAPIQFGKPSVGIFFLILNAYTSRQNRGKRNYVGIYIPHTTGLRSRTLLIYEIAWIAWKFWRGSNTSVKNNALLYESAEKRFIFCPIFGGRTNPSGEIVAASSSAAQTLVVNNDNFSTRSSSRNDRRR